MSSSTQEKLFTVEEANNLLPQIRTILDEFRDRIKTYFELKQEVKELTEIVDNEEYRSEELSVKERILMATSREIENLFDEIAKLGCIVKDMDSGLVDFFSIYRGKKIFLCWKLEEESISWYHDVNSGYPGREKIIDPAEFKNSLNWENKNSN